MGNWKWIVFGALAALAVGCGSDQGSAGTTTGTTGASAQSTTTGGGVTPSGGTSFNVAFVTNNASDYWTIAQKGTAAAVDELRKDGTDVNVDFQIPPTGIAAEQKQIIQSLLAKGVQGIAISPVDPPNETGLLNTAAQKTLVITQDSDAPNSNRACYIGSDNVAAGKQVGEAIKKALPSGGKAVFFVGNIGAANAKERFDGIKEALQGSNVQVGPVITDQADHTRAKANASDEIVKDPDVACMVGLWSYNGPAIRSAVESHGKQGKIKVVCFDGDDDTLAGVKNGTISATVVQQPFAFGHDAVVDMVKYLKGDKSIFPANKLIYVPTEVIDSSNVDKYIADNNKLLGK